MTRKAGIAVLCGFLLSSCSERGCTREAAVNAASTAAAKRIGDLIEFAPDSPQLSRIRVGDAQAERVPIDEVVAPGKIEANPNRVSKIALPVAGRIRKVLVGLGDSVEENKPIVLMESPEIP